MASYGNSKPRIVLDKPEQWDAWLSHIKRAVNNDDIWTLVNPDSLTKPARTEYPREPPRPLFDQDGQVNQFDMERYKAFRLFREEDLTKIQQRGQGP